MTNGFPWRLGLAALLVVLESFYFGWQISTGAIPRQTATQTSAPAIACDFAMAGSNTIGEKLAPAIVAAYFRSQGYSVSEPQTVAEDEIRFTATKGAQVCTIDIRAKGSSVAFRELVSGAALIGMASRPIKESELESLRTANAGDFAAEAALAEHVIALDGIAIIVHPSNRASTLSRANVRDIFLGQARDWRRFGGAGTITRYARNDESGTFQFFQEHVLANDERWDIAKGETARFESSSQLVQRVAADPQAIGFSGMAYVNESVTALPISDGGPAFAPTPRNVRTESYPISRRLFLYVRPSTMRDNPQIAALVNYFKSPAAYDLVDSLGYASLRPMTPGEAQAPVCDSNAPEVQAYQHIVRDAEQLSTVIRFQPSSNAIDSLARDDLNRAASAIRDALQARRSVHIVGHSDSAGDAAANRILALERAQAIRAEFERQGIFGVNLESAGERCPLAGNDSPQGRQTNRRVEIWIERS